MLPRPHDRGEDTVFTRKELRQFTNQQDYRLRVTLNELIEMEYVGVVSGCNGKAFHYRLLDGVPSLNPVNLLTTPDELDEILRRESGPCE